MLFLLLYYFKTIFATNLVEKINGVRWKFLATPRQREVTSRGSRLCDDSQSASCAEATSHEMALCRDMK